jgi:hypothetical protein
MQFSRTTPLPPASIKVRAKIAVDTAKTASGDFGLPARKTLLRASFSRLRILPPMSSPHLVDRRYVLAWCTVALFALIDAVWLRASGLSVTHAGVLGVCKASVTLMAIALLLRLLARVPRYNAITERLRYARVADTAAWAAVLVCFISATCVLSYLCVSIDAPLIEGRLIAFDRAMGFDWIVVYEWVAAHPIVQGTLRLAYESGHLQLVAVPIIVGLSGRREGLAEFFFCLAIASALLLVISTPFPATSAFVHFDVNDQAARATVSDFALLRDGALKVIDITAAQGLVSMPSFHTTLAVLFMYSLRQYRILFRTGIALNVVMILSTPTQGGHYLADVFAGLLLAAATIVAYRALFDRRRLRLSLRVALLKAARNTA